jgi:hypothetical protein
VCVLAAVSGLFSDTPGTGPPLHLALTFLGASLAAQGIAALLWHEGSEAARWVRVVCIPLHALMFVSFGLFYYWVGVAGAAGRALLLLFAFEVYWRRRPGVGA